MGLVDLLTGRFVVTFSRGPAKRRRDPYARIDCDVPVKRTRLERRLLEGLNDNAVTPRRERGNRLLRRPPRH